MSKTADLLFELLVEELPAKSLKAMSAALQANMEAELGKAGLSFSKIQSFATPRRLAFLVEALATEQPLQFIERRGPAVSAAFDAKGTPTPAALGFARSVGAEIDELERLSNEQGEFLAFRQERPGSASMDLLPAMIQAAVKQLPLEKSMHWFKGEQSFIRPVRSVLCLLGSDIVPMTLFGLETTHKTQGHRFHYPGTISLRKPKTYMHKLHDAHVIADFVERQALILEQVQAMAKRKKARAIISPALLEEVTGLVEWPVAMMGHFEVPFLSLPKAVLTTSMETHQKYFPLQDVHGNILPYFITISNIDSKDPDAVIQGNEKVLRARLNDAAFFYELDRKQTLESRVPALNQVLFQAELGSLYEKTERLEILTASLARILGLSESQAKRAAYLSLADLGTQMVGEFPELQGVMGHAYALHEGEPEEIAEALEARYQPRSAKDSVPESRLAQVLSLAERMDTLVGILGINQGPTGDKDPFALRRTALGLLRILLDAQISLDLPVILSVAQSLYDTKLKNPNVIKDSIAFLTERLKYRLIEEGYSAELFAAVALQTLVDPLDLYRRIQALKIFQKVSGAKFLIQANKRVKNILKQQEKEVLSENIEDELLILPEEQNLHTAVREAREVIARLMQAHHYPEVFAVLASLENPLSDFFEKVMVMSEDLALRRNRLSLLKQTRLLFLSIADLSVL